MQIKMYPSWPNLLGRKQAFVGTGNGPALYTPGANGGDVVTLTEYNTSIDYLISGAVSVSGNYVLQAFPDSPGPRAVWKVRWFAAPGNALPGPITAWTEATAINLAAETVIISGFSSGT